MDIDGSPIKKSGSFFNPLYRRAMPPETDLGTYAVNGNTIDLTIKSKHYAERHQWILNSDGKKLDAYTSPSDTQPTVWVRRYRWRMRYDAASQITGAPVPPCSAPNPGEPAAPLQKPRKSPGLIFG
ncbi:MAG: hypothetical protein ACYC96_03615 [Fimbriimonadaceae bacterium]